MIEHQEPTFSRPVSDRPAGEVRKYAFTRPVVRQYENTAPINTITIDQWFQHVRLTDRQTERRG